MSSKGKPLFDLNEPAAEEDEESDGVFSFQPQRAVPSTTHTSDLFTTSNNSPRRIINNNAFSHASSVSGFQPFIRSKVTQTSEVNEDQKRVNDVGPVVEKEEGEWSDNEVSPDVDPEKSTPVLDNTDDKSEVKPIPVQLDQKDSSVAVVVDSAPSIVDNVKDENSKDASVGVDTDSIDRKSSDSQEDSNVVPKQRDVKGVEAIHALKIANNHGKRPKIDHQKEAMLGKKRSRQTMFLNLEDVKQVGTIKTTTPRRQNFPPPVTTRIVKESRLLPSSTNGDKQIQPPMAESSGLIESSDSKSESNNGSDMNSGILGRPKRSISGTDLALKQTKNVQVSGRKSGVNSQSCIDQKTGSNCKKVPSKKPLLNVASNQYQDTSVERLLREVTNDKFWQHPGLKMLHKV